MRELTRFDPAPFPTRLAAEVGDFDPLDHLEPKQARRFDRFSQFAVAAARQAVADAGLCLDSLGRDDVGCYLGSALGGVAFAETQHQAYLDARRRRK